MYKYQMNELIINDIKRTFNYDVRNVLEFNKYYFILLSIPFDKSEINNIYCVDNKNDLLWRSEDLNVLFPEQKNLPYEQMGIKDNELYASDFYGRNYCINPLNGRVGKYTIVR